MNKIITLVLALFAIGQSTIAQVEEVNYRLKFDAELCQFDAFMVVNAGATKTTLDRAQFNAQITIVAPVTSNVYITESYMPLMDNQNRRSSSPAEWSVGNEVENPQQLEGMRLVSVIPELLPAAFYDDLTAGDEVRLFSFKVSPMTACASDVRLYDNERDPSSIGKGMGGADFRNGFTIGGVDQKYALNSAPVLPANPVIESVDFSMNGQISLDIALADTPTSKCQKGMTYDVIAPNGAVVDYQTFLKTDKKDILRADYTVRATDGLGCTAEKTFNAFNKSDGDESVVTVSEFVSGIYPNPAQRDFSVTVEGAAGTTVVGDIVDVEGRVIAAKLVNATLLGGEESFVVKTDLNPGMYNLVLTVNGSEKVNHKLLIIK